MPPQEKVRGDFYAMAEALRSFEGASQLPVDYYTDPVDSAGSNRAAISNVLIPTGHKLTGAFGATILYGAMTDTMIDAGVELRGAVEREALQPGIILIGAGMRALHGGHDERGVRWLRRHGLQEPLTTETDAAEAVAKILFGGTLVDEVSGIETPGTEALNNLGARPWVYRRYAGRDGQDLVVVNGKSVDRSTPLRKGLPKDNRHTTESVMREIAYLFPEETHRSELLVVAASLHAVRMGAETAAVLGRDVTDPKITIYPVLSHLDKYGVNAAQIARDAYLSHVPKQADKLQLTPELEPRDGDLLAYANFHAAVAMLLLEQPAHVQEFKPGRPLSAYLDTVIGNAKEVRRTFEPAKLLESPEALERAYAFLSEMGFGSSEHAQYRGEKPYTAALEGGRALKYAKELQLIDEQETAPQSIALFGTPHRIVGSDMASVEREFEEVRDGMSESIRSRLEKRLAEEGVITEYDLAEAFALERVVDNNAQTPETLVSDYTLDGEIIQDSNRARRQVRYWGSDAAGVPVLTVMVDREYKLDDGVESFTGLGVAGSLQLTEAVTKLMAQRGLLPSEAASQSAVAHVSSHLYAPTRRMYIEGFNKIRSEKNKFVGLFYGPGAALPKDAKDLSDIQVRQLGSELRTIVHSVERVRSEAEQASALVSA